MGRQCLFQVCMRFPVLDILGIQDHDVNSSSGFYITGFRGLWVIFNVLAWRDSKA